MTQVTKVITSVTDLGPPKKSRVTKVIPTIDQKLTSDSDLAQDRPSEAEDTSICHSVQ